MEPMERTNGILTFSPAEPVFVGDYWKAVKNGYTGTYDEYEQNLYRAHCSLCEKFQIEAVSFEQFIWDEFQAKRQKPMEKRGRDRK